MHSDMLVCFTKIQSNKHVCKPTAAQIWGRCCKKYRGVADESYVETEDDTSDEEDGEGSDEE